MQLTDLEVAVLQDRYRSPGPATPEALAERLGITLGEIREAEKTALRKFDDPGHVSVEGLRKVELSDVERAVLRELHCTPQRTPETLAAEFGVSLVEVLEAEKQAMRKLEDPEHATRETLDALGVRE